MRKKEYENKINFVLKKYCDLTRVVDNSDDENTYYYNVGREPIMNYNQDTLLLTISISDEDKFFDILNTEVIRQLEKIGTSVKSVRYDTIYNKGEVELTFISDCDNS